MQKKNQGQKNKNRRIEIANLKVDVGGVTPTGQDGATTTIIHFSKSQA